MWHIFFVRIKETNKKYTKWTESGLKDTDYISIMVYRKTVSRLRSSCRNNESYDDELNRFMDFYENKERRQIYMEKK